MSTVNPCAFRKDGQGFVHLRGVASGGNATYTVFYLPAGYRPANYLSFGNPTPSVFVGTNGAVAGGTGVSTLYLDGITFLADQ